MAEGKTNYPLERRQIVLNALNVFIKLSHYLPRYRCLNRWCGVLSQSRYLRD